MYSTNHRNPTPPPSSSTFLSDTSPGLGQAYCVYASLSLCSPASLLVIPSSPRLPSSSKSHFTPLPPHDVLSHRYSTQSTSLQLQVVVPVVLFLGVGLYLCFLLTTIPSVILCLRTHCAALFVLNMHVFAGELIKNS